MSDEYLESEVICISYFYTYIISIYHICIAGDDIIKQVLLSFLYGGLSGFLGLLISDYIISTGNKDNTASLSNISIAVDRRRINYNATSHDVTMITNQSQHDIPRITNSDVIFDKDDDGYNMIIPQHQRINNHEQYSHDNYHHEHHNHDSKEEVSIHSMKSYQQHMLEGGILFATFEIVAYLLEIIVPEQFNLKFSFNQFLQIVEKDLNPTIPIDL